MEGLPWVEKYRPHTLDELISHKDIIHTINKFIDENRLPHLLFYGPPGTGKTSTILACARKLYGNKLQSMTLELNASDDRGIEVVRNQIKDFASTKVMFSSNFKLIILDEADAMTQAAQAALRRIIEKYTKNVRFCIICNYVSKIIPALQSRCTRFRFSPLQKEQIQDRLQYVLTQENVKIDEKGMDALIRLSFGDMRKALNILQASSASFGGTISEEVIYMTTGNPIPSDIEEIIKYLLNENFTKAYSFIQQLKTTKGLALVDIISEIHPFVIMLEIPQQVRMYLVDSLGQIEGNLAAGCSEKIQLGSLVGSFQIARESAIRIVSNT